MNIFLKALAGLLLVLSVPAKATVYYIDSGNPLGTGTYNFDAQVTKKTASFFDEWR
ncbi:MAG: hypothetical protein CALGDGBN_02320 [Pseudomonadales bacterium]|nr:hypothetical protein [Pseudomonadales bacterium]